MAHIVIPPQTASAHTIEDATQSFTQRSNLQFVGDVTVTDDLAADRTIVSVTGSVGGGLSGTIQPNQIAFGVGVDVIGGDSDLSYSNATKTLSAIIQASSKQRMEESSPLPSPSPATAADLIYSGGAIARFARWPCIRNGCYD